RLGTSLAGMSAGAGSGTAGLDDPDNYLVLARGLAEGRGFVWDGRPTAYRPPLYPLVLALLVAVLGSVERLRPAIAGLHALLGAATIAATALAARRWGLGRARVLFAATIVAFDPVLVAQSRMVMTETLAAFLLAAAMGALGGSGGWSAVSAGVALGLSA